MVALVVLLILIVLYIQFAMAIFMWKHPNLNKMQVFRHLTEVIMLRKLVD